MKKLTLSLWLALAAAGIFAMQAKPSSHAGWGAPVPDLPAVLPTEVDLNIHGGGSSAPAARNAQSVGSGSGRNTLNQASQQRVMAATK